MDLREEDHDVAGLRQSQSSVGGVVAICAQGGDSSDVVGSILIAGVVLAIVGLIIHFAGVHVVNRVLPPAVTGAVVMLIGFNLAPVAAGICLVIWLATFLLFRYASLASIVTAVALPIVCIVLGEPWPTVIATYCLPFTA